MGPRLTERFARVDAKRGAWLLLIVALLGVPLAACGSSDEAVDKAPDKTSAAQKDKNAKFEGDNNSKFCTVLREIDEFERAADTSNVSKMYTDLLSKAKELQKASPSEIRVQIDDYVDFMNKTVDKLKKADWDIAALEGDDGIDVKEFSKNMAVLSKYSTEVCGIEESP